MQGEKERLLVAAGYAPDALAHHYQCPTCKDTGYVGDRMCTCQRELLKDLQRGGHSPLGALGQLHL